MLSYFPQMWDTPVLGHSGARWEIEGAAAPSCLGVLGVFRGPPCPKATHWVFFSWAIPMQTSLDRWRGDRWHWHGWH